MTCCYRGLPQPHPRRGRAGFAKYADLGPQDGLTASESEWGPGPAFSKLPGCSGKPQTLIPGVDHGGAWGLSGRKEAETGSVEGPGRAGEAWESHSVAAGQGGPGTNLFLSQDCLPALPQEFRPHVPPVACGSTQPSLNTFAKERRRYRARLRHSGSGVRKP